MPQVAPPPEMPASPPQPTPEPAASKPPPPPPPPVIEPSEAPVAYQPGPEAEPAAEPRPEPELAVVGATQTEVPYNKGKGGIITGTIFDVVGYVLVIVGGAVSSLNLGLSLNMLYSGSGILTIGSIIGTSAYTAKHGAYRRAGYEVRSGPKIGSWIMTSFTIGCTGAAIGTGVASDGDFGLAIASLVFAGTAAILEVINWLSIRGKSWNNALNESSGGVPASY